MCENHPCTCVYGVCLYPASNPKQGWLLQSGNAWQLFLAFRMHHLSSSAQILHFALCQEQLPAGVTLFSLLSHKAL